MISPACSALQLLLPLLPLLLHAGSCTLDLELATEDFDSREEALLYPFNAARNRALMLAQTEARRCTAWLHCGMTLQRLQLPRAG